VFSVSNRRALKCVRQVAGGAERSPASVDAPGKPGRDLLEQPHVSAGIAELGTRAVGPMLGIRTTLAAARADVKDLAPNWSFGMLYARTLA
jgi:hypothetical protein